MDFQIASSLFPKLESNGMHLEAIERGVPEDETEGLFLS